MASKKSTRKSSRNIQNNQIPTPSGRGLTQKRVLPNLRSPKIPTKSNQNSNTNSTSKSNSNNRPDSLAKSRSKSPAKSSTKVTIAFQSRYERIQHEFSQNSTLSEVLEFFKEKLHLPSLLASNTFINGIPKKQFKKNDKSKSLKQLGITERTAFLYQD